MLPGSLAFGGSVFVTLTMNKPCQQILDPFLCPQKTKLPIRNKTPLSVDLGISTRDR